MPATRTFAVMQKENAVNAVHGVIVAALGAAVMSAAMSDAGLSLIYMLRHALFD